MSRGAGLTKVSKRSVVGVDLAGVHRKPTGWALLRGGSLVVKTIYRDDDIISYTLKANPTITSIDAPLTLPKKGAIRGVDLEMRRHGYPVLPPLFPGMKSLTLRAIRLVKRLSKSGLSIIEIHPESTRKALGLPKDPGKIKEAFQAIGLAGDFISKTLTLHETDAVLAALTAYLHLVGKTESIGDGVGIIVVPKRVGWEEIHIAGT